MNRLRLATAAALVVVLVAAGYGWWRTQPSGASPRWMTAHVAGTAKQIVDRSTLDAAMHLSALARTPEEYALLQDAVATADHLLDLDFAAALRAATDSPPPTTPIIDAAQHRLDEAAQQMVADNLEVQRLTELVARNKAKTDGSLEAQLALAQSQFEVDQYDFEQAGKALMDAGGDLRGRIQALVAEHQASGSKMPPLTGEAAPKAGLVHLLARALELRRKLAAIDGARAALGTRLSALATRRSEVAGRIDENTRTVAAGRAQSGHADALLVATRQIASDQRRLRDIDESHESAQHLDGDYARWRALVAAQGSALAHRILSAVLIIAVACLLLMFFGRWLGAAFDRLRVDRRQVQTLRTVTTVALQIAAVFIILLVIIGPPTQLGTILGLAGAGLTVALKDFIVAFIGWLVLMGRNGIRIGDWVEINGVAGEVVELGMFHTVLLETGNWTDSGHPTGRRVTFTNSFAIQGYYFNFSTSGQWLWDELQLVVPAGQDLYAVVGAISRRVQEATAENIRLAEEEWRRAAPSLKLTGLSAAPAINVKPVLGGTEIALRYIARASERHALRARLYEAAVELLSPKPAHAPRG